MKKTERLIILGDIMIGRGINPLVKNFGISHILGSIKEKYPDAGFVSNLECVLLKEELIENNTDHFSTKLGANRAFAQELKDYGFIAMSLANNHTFDYGYTGLASTIETLTNNDILCFGAGKDKDEAHTPSIIELCGKKVGLLGFSFTNAATQRSPGVAYLYDEDQVLDCIQKTKSCVDFVIAMPHTGIEMYQYPLERDRKIYKKMVDAGVDLIAGNQSHCVQVQEYYQGKHIFYSLGDLLFDHHLDVVWQDFNSDVSHIKKFNLQATRSLPQHSLLLEVTIEKGALKVSYDIVKNIEAKINILDLDERDVWQKKYTVLCEEFMHNLEIQAQRKKIEETLLQSLKERKLL